MLQFIVAPLMTGQWRGRVFDHASTGVLMQRLQQAMRSPHQCKADPALVVKLNYVLTENLSASIMYADEICC